MAQETLVRTLQALRDKRRKAPEHLGAFVRGVARHVISDMWAARRCAQPLEALPGGECRAAREDPLCALVTQEEREHVRRALQRLLPSDRYILHLSFFEGLTHSEICQQLELPLGTVKSRLRLAFAKLRKAMGDAS